MLARKTEKQGARGGRAADDGSDRGVASTRHRAARIFVVTGEGTQGPRTVQWTSAASALNGDKITAAAQRPADPRTVPVSPTVAVRDQLTFRWTIVE
jgi:hypothetical protein